MIATEDRPLWAAVCTHLDRRRWHGDDLLAHIIRDDLAHSASFPTVTIIIPTTLEDRLAKPLAVAQADAFVRSLGVRP